MKIKLNGQILYPTDSVAYSGLKTDRAWKDIQK